MLVGMFYICVETNFVDFEELCGFMTSVWNKYRDRLSFVSSPDVIVCG